MDECYIRKFKDPNVEDDAAPKRYVDHPISAVVDRAPVRFGPLDMGRYSIINLRDRSNGSDVATKRYIDGSI
jgi:hypothetical protein